MWTIVTQACDYGVRGLGNYAASYINWGSQTGTFDEKLLLDPLIAAARISILIQQGEKVKFHIKENDIVYTRRFMNIGGRDPIQGSFRGMDGASQADFEAKGIFEYSVTNLITIYPKESQAAPYIATLLKIQALGIYWSTSFYNGIVQSFANKYLEQINLYVNSVAAKFIPDYHLTPIPQYKGRTAPPSPEQMDQWVKEAALFWEKIKDSYRQGAPVPPCSKEIDEEVRKSWQLEDIRSLVVNIFKCFENTDNRSILDDQLNKKVANFKRIIDKIKVRHLVNTPHLPQLPAPIQPAAAAPTNPPLPEFSFMNWQGPVVEEYEPEAKHEACEETA